MAVFLLLACELDLTLVALAIGIGLRNSEPRFTIAATAVVAALVSIAGLVVWLLWYVAPVCVIDGCPDQAVSPMVAVYLVSAATAQWIWLLAIALAARFAKSRSLAHVS